jgi:hypothetical protein
MRANTAIPVHKIGRIHNALQGRGHSFLMVDSESEVLSMLNNPQPAEWARHEESTSRIVFGHAQAAARDSVNAAALQADSSLHISNHVEWEKAAEGMMCSFRQLTEKWMQAGKDLNKAPELRTVVDQFLGKNHPQLRSISPYTPAAASFSLPPTGDAFVAVEWHLGSLTLRLVASHWSAYLFRCPRCSKYFVKPRAQSAEPRCSRKCRIREGSKKKRQRERRKQDKLQALTAAIGKLDRRSRGRYSRADLASEATDIVKRGYADKGQNMPEYMRVTPSFYNRYVEELPVPAKLGIER